MNIQTAAAKLGRERGMATGSWLIDANISDDTAQAIITGYEDGDPDVMDLCPPPLSGEWADDPTPAGVLAQLGLDDMDDTAPDVLDAYEDAFSSAFWAEVIRAAEAVLS